MTRMKPTSTWIAFRRKYGLRAAGIPDRGYCVALRGGQKYDTCFATKPRARQGARLLAEATCAGVYVVQVRDHGNDRFILH